MGKKITEYTNTRNTFDDGDLFDVSAFLNPGYESQKTTYAIFKANLVSAGFLSNGDVDLSYTAATRTIGNTAGDDAVLPLFTSTEAGLVPLSGGGTTNFLRADGTWASAGADTNFANTDLTLLTDRIHTLGTNVLTLNSTKTTTGGSVVIDRAGGNGSALKINKSDGNGFGLDIDVQTVTSGGINVSSSTATSQLFNLSNSLGTCFQHNIYSGTKNTITIGSQAGARAFNVIGNETFIGGNAYINAAVYKSTSASEGVSLGWNTARDGLLFSFGGFEFKSEAFYNTNGVGILTTPTSTDALKVGGDTYIDGNLRIDTPTPSVLGQVWTATDAFGNGSWQTPSGGNTLYSADDNLAGNRVVTLSDGATTDRSLVFRSVGDASLLTLNSVANRVGIGTNNPESAKLTVRNSNANAYNIVEQYSGGQSMRHTVEVSATDVIFDLFKSNGTRVFRVDSRGAGNPSYFNTGGNLGIGTTTPSAKLHVGGNAQIDGTLFVNNSGTHTIGTGTGSPILELDGSTNPTFRLKDDTITKVNLSVNNGFGGKLDLYNSTGTLITSINGNDGASSESYFLDKVAIGTSTATATTHLTIEKKNASFNPLIIKDEGGVERFSVRSAGNVAINIVGLASERLDVGGNANVSGVYKVGGVSGINHTEVINAKTFTWTGGILTSVV